MQNHVKNTMQLEKDHAIKGFKIMAIFVPKCNQNHGKE